LLRFAMPKPRLEYLKLAAAQLLACRFPSHLAHLLEVEDHTLALLAAQPQYQVFQLAKPSGGFRQIEAPDPNLKAVLRRLNFHLQALYFLRKSAAAYGYILSPKFSNKPRNIVTNAEQHLAGAYMLNADFEDFFHQVSQADVAALLAAPPFSFHADTVELLARLCCFRGRLPMGSPTSPALSNFATLPLDMALAQLVAGVPLVYTRFVDDLTFSGPAPVDEATWAQIEAVCAAQGFRFNPAKTKRYGPTDPKIVTGLLLDRGRVGLPQGFYTELADDLRRLRYTAEASQMMEGKPNSGLAEKMRLQVLGKVNFLGMVLGAEHPKYQKYAAQYERAIAPEVDTLSLRWLDFPYQNL
jgi:hypothetical protein